MKHFSGVSKIAVLLLMLALPAVASAPIIVISPFTPFVLPAGPDTCSFDIYFKPQPGRPNDGKLILFANGSQFAVFHGVTFVTATNLSNFKSIELNISGPGTFSVTNNTATLLGPILDFGLPPNLLPPGLPPVSYSHGQIVLQFDNSATILLSVSFNGTAQDVCQLLQ